MCTECSVKDWQAVCRPCGLGGLAPEACSNPRAPLLPRWNAPTKRRSLQIGPQTPKTKGQ